MELASDRSLNATAPAPGEKVRIGVDIGGTFTDVTIIGEASGRSENFKVLTTPKDPARGVLSAISDSGVHLERVSFLSHGTTVAINAVLEQKGAQTAILTTSGFEDILELRRGARTSLTNPLMEKPPIFVPRRRRFGVSARILSDGTEHTPLSEQELVEVLGEMRRAGVESVAVCFLHSYLNRTHETAVRDFFAREAPEISVTVCSELVPEIKEYERTSTGALNAYIQPVVGRYLSRLERELQSRGLGSDLHVMQSNGGVMTAREAAIRPIHILESGPAAGAIGAVAIGERIGDLDLITFDMGGTTSKATVIEKGRPLRTFEYELFESHNKPGSGWPLRVPMVDIIEVGTGGGSIAWLDDAKILHVGPQSAGADPGPVCYDRGGTEPTITDANAVLGRLVALLDGQLPLNVAKARQAVEERIARPAGMTVEAAAAGILQIADAKTADVIREVTIARGRDPRDFSLVVYGGAGPLQTAYLVRELGVKRGIIPPSPGNFSALGLLATDIIHDSVQAYISASRKADPEKIEGEYRRLAADLRAVLLKENIPADRIDISRSVDVRYMGQFHVVEVTIGEDRVDRETISSIEDAFHLEHERLYTHHNRGAEIEFVNLRVRAVGRVTRPSIPEVAPGSSDRGFKGTRSVYFREIDAFAECKVYSRAGLGRGSRCEGPAIIEEQTSTTLIPPGFQAEVDAYGNMILEQSR